METPDRRTAEEQGTPPRTAGPTGRAAVYATRAAALIAGVAAIVAGVLHGVDQHTRATAHLHARPCAATAGATAGECLGQEAGTVTKKYSGEGQGPDRLVVTRASGRPASYVVDIGVYNTVSLGETVELTTWHDSITTISADGRSSPVSQLGMLAVLSTALLLGLGLFAVEYAVLIPRTKNRRVLPAAGLGLTLCAALGTWTALDTTSWWVFGADVALCLGGAAAAAVYLRRAVRPAP
ncbi:hypothetical protein KNE206_75550 [Kitasatospora sp. NE20-6]|uniref:hypothetical protein n=1 Tax=Kitasatospora sp. NE20-6 TaxID=2859066 RepID=UPI0034DCB57D